MVYRVIEELIATTPGDFPSKFHSGGIIRGSEAAPPPDLPGEYVVPASSAVHLNQGPDYEIGLSDWKVWWTH